MEIQRHEHFAHENSANSDDALSPKLSSQLATGKEHDSASAIEKRDSDPILETEIDEKIAKWSRKHPWLARDQQLIAQLRDHLRHPQPTPTEYPSDKRPDPATGVVE